MICSYVLLCMLGWISQKTDYEIEISLKEVYLECSVLQGQALGERGGGRREEKQDWAGGRPDLWPRWWGPHGELWSWDIPAELTWLKAMGPSSRHQPVIGPGLPWQCDWERGWQQLSERTVGKSISGQQLLGLEELFSSECFCSDRGHRTHSTICHATRQVQAVLSKPCFISHHVYLHGFRWPGLPGTRNDVATNIPTYQVDPRCFPGDCQMEFDGVGCLLLPLMVHQGYLGFINLKLYSSLIFAIPMGLWCLNLV